MTIWLPLKLNVGFNSIWAVILFVVSFYCFAQSHLHCRLLIEKKTWNFTFNSTFILFIPFSNFLPPSPSSFSLFPPSHISNRTFGWVSLSKLTLLSSCAFLCVHSWLNRGPCREEKSYVESFQVLVKRAKKELNWSATTDMCVCVCMEMWVTFWVEFFMWSNWNKFKKLIKINQNYWIRNWLNS